MWLFPLTAGLVACFFRIAGVIYERTVDCGEILIKDKHDNIGKYAYNVGELVGSIMGNTSE